MKQLQLLTTTFVIYCLASIYSLYTTFHRVFVTGSRVRGAFGSGAGSFRSRFSAQSGHIPINLSSWANDLSLLCIAVIIGLFAFRPVASYPKWFRWIVVAAIILIVLQIIVSFLHVGGVPSNFQRFNGGGQFGQPGSSFPQQSGNSAQPS